MQHASSSRNQRTLAVLVVAIAAMTGLAFASVPLYRVFCQATGFEGTTQRAERTPGAVGGKLYTVHGAPAFKRRVYLLENAQTVARWPWYEPAVAWTLQEA